MPSLAIRARRQSPWFILAIVSLPVFIGALDLTIISAVLPEVIISLDLPVKEYLDQASWAVNGYLLAYAISMTFTGRLSDLFGRRPIYITCLLIFIAGSYLVTIYDNGTLNSLLARFYRQVLGEEPPRLAERHLYLVIAGRVIQAFGAGAMVPVTLALVGDIFPAGKRARPLGVIGAVDTLGWVLGHLYGGVMVRLFGEHGGKLVDAATSAGLTIAHPSWETLFILNIPISLLALLGAWWALSGISRRKPFSTESPMPDTEAAGLEPPHPSPTRAARLKRLLPTPANVRRAHFDLLGAILISLALVGLNLGLGGSAESATSASSFEELGEQSGGGNAGFLIMGAVALILFVLVENWVDHPLVPLSLFRDRNLTSASISNLLVGFCLAIGLVSAPLLVNFRVDRPTSGEIQEAAYIAGLLLSGLTIPMAAAAIPGSWLSDRYGYRVPTAVGLGLASIGFLLAGLVWESSTSYWVMGGQMSIIGVGLGLTISPIGTAVINSAREDDRGIASALILILRLVGMTLAISSLTIFSLDRFDQLIAESANAGATDLGDAIATSQLTTLDAAVKVISEMLYIGAAISAAGLFVALFMRGGRSLSFTGSSPVSRPAQPPSAHEKRTTHEQLRTPDS